MFSNKMAFSLVSLITIFGIAFVVPTAMAADPFDVTFEGRESVPYVPTDDPVPVTVLVTIKMGQSVVDPAPSLTVFDKNGIPIVNRSDEPDGAMIVESTATDYVATGTRREYVLTIDPMLQEERMVAKVVILVGELTTNDPTAVDDSGTLVKTKLKSYTRTITLTKGPTSNNSRPNVVSIQRLRPSSQTVVAAFEEAEVTGAFDIRIVFTELPYDFNLDKINVEGGTASNLVVGTPFAWHGGRNADGTRNATETLRPHPSEGMYAHSGTGPLAGVPAGVDGVTVPQPSGDDGMYHQYRVTITPHRRSDMVKVSITEFHDNASPFPNVYKPFDVEHKPNGREQLRLAVATDFTALGAESIFSPLHEENTQVTGTNGTSGDEISTKDEGGSGASPFVDAAEVKVVEESDISVSIPMEGQIYISEIMFAGGVRLPQWIEISNGSRTEQVNLSGWTLTVENATAEANVSVGEEAVFTIPEGIRIDPSGQNDTPSTVLVVTDTGRNNLDGWMADGQVVSLWRDQQIALILLGVTDRRYSLLSDIAFKITLAPPAALITPPAADVIDVVGNLVPDDGTVAWALPIAEGAARSSIIRRHVQGTTGSAEPKEGTMMDSWVLASDTGFAQSTHLSTHSYYGLPIDIGTPGFRAGGALPVELSHFRPARNKETGAVVITWSTQSELNNAGFFIKRSNQKDGEFKVINATMVAGAGTTSEKQFYTYTDTTAQPNVVYYYQIEDVSLDGNRQTLTRGIRLKGHVGAAGKATTLWGELKTSHE